MDPSICSEPACRIQNNDNDEDCADEVPDADVLRTFYDGAESTSQLFAVKNVNIVSDDSDSFAKDKARMARQCVFKVCTCTDLAVKESPPQGQCRSRPYTHQRQR